MKHDGESIGHASGRRRAGAIHQPGQPQDGNRRYQVGRVEPGVGLDERELDLSCDGERDAHRKEPLAAGQLNRRLTDRNGWFVDLSPGA